MHKPHPSMNAPRRAWRAVLAVPLIACMTCITAGSALGQDAAAPASPARPIDTLKRIRDTGVVLLGVREASVPFSFLDARKEAQGYTVDLCLRAVDAIRAELKLKRLDTRYVPVSSASRIAALLGGEIDLECGSTTNTRERAQQVAFAYTTFVAGIKMLARKESNINGIEDLRGRTVVVTKGTTSEKMVKRLNAERALELTILETDDHDQSFKAVEDGRAVAFPMDDVLLYGLVSRSKQPDAFAVVGKYMSVEPYAIMMRKDDRELARIVDGALNELFRSGEIRKIYAKWFATPELTVPLSQLLREAFQVPNTYPAWP
jgi:glutamate/aspartate transport system substrate-binding protein